MIAEQIKTSQKIHVHFTVASSPEATFFAQQLAKALELGGWIIDQKGIAIPGSFKILILK